NESFGARLRADALLLAIAGNGFAVGGGFGVLAADDGLGDSFEIERTNGLEDFELFVADGGGVERSGGFYGDERRELKDVALNHVAKSTGGFIKAATALDAERLGGGDLYVIDVVAVPERLENAVAEAENEQVLNRVFAEVVVNSIDLIFFEDIVN